MKVVVYRNFLNYGYFSCNLLSCCIARLFAVVLGFAGPREEIFSNLPLIV